VVAGTAAVEIAEVVHIAGVEGFDTPCAVAAAAWQFCPAQPSG